MPLPTSLAPESLLNGKALIDPENLTAAVALERTFVGSVEAFSCQKLGSPIKWPEKSKRERSPKTQLEACAWLGYSTCSRNRGISIALLHRTGRKLSTLFTPCKTRNR